MQRTFEPMLLSLSCLNLVRRRSARYTNSSFSSPDFFKVHGVRRCIVPFLSHPVIALPEPFEMILPQFVTGDI